MEDEGGGVHWDDWRIEGKLEVGVVPGLQIVIGARTND